MKTSFVYILTNKNKTTLYIGVTNNLERRLSEHKENKGSKFTKKYQVKHLIYYEVFENISDAIKREKQLKGWSRMKKENIINKINPDWDFLEGNLL